jgi:hypothetical protein
MLNLFCNLLFSVVSAPLSTAVAVLGDNNYEQNNSSYDSMVEDSHENGGYGPDYGPQ